MGLQERFRATANKLVEKFSVGNVILKKLLTEDYDTDTGIVTRTWNDVSVPAASYACSARKGFETYNKTHFICVLSGTDLAGVVPTTGDIIEYVDGKFHLIEDIDYDQYQAAYFLMVNKLVWAT